MLPLPPENPGAHTVYSRTRRFWIAAAKHQLNLDRAVGLDLKPCIFEVEVSFDTASGLVAQAALVPELEQRRPLRAQQLPPKALERQRAFLGITILLAVLRLPVEASGVAAAAKLVKVAYPLGRVLSTQSSSSSSSILLTPPPPPVGALRLPRSLRRLLPPTGPDGE